ncbi:MULTISPECIES: type I-B CRISPR-associated protein Cas5b [Porphyromonadaceae]|uniref:CRISPR-associated protein Cas5 n=1 Tax=Sanguibacteroides justesenii TaxID=1547597 RepID=A0AB34R3E0_9PORP|nr:MULTISPECIES: type I-B CRISPR-associated protein Cas5b [Porphyromonadaceae]KIO43540.1 CRISPR-associated protein Cas5 [Sanguibacteroides justesenii]PXZ45204.1 type I-B CRISPR-associated protein Cas5 [Sanguibacteroides justesenii]
MKLYRIKISSWTASFRYPNILSGYQPTLEVPPVSTVLGLMNACAGEYLNHEKLEIGYYFEYGAKEVDLETIYQIERTDKGTPKNEVKSNVIKREFLFDCRLYVYLSDVALVTYFKQPYFPLVLGRSSDLASVELIEEIELQEIVGAEHIKGQLVPFKGNFLPGVIQVLSNYFTDEIPRRNIGPEPYSVISCFGKTGKTNIKAYRDVIDNSPVDIYLHQLIFEK